MKGILCLLLALYVGGVAISDCPKDILLDHYNRASQFAGARMLTGKAALQGSVFMAVE